MKISRDESDVMLAPTLTVVKDRQDRLEYESPMISLLSLASVIAGPGGSQLDDDWDGNKTEVING